MTSCDGVFSFPVSWNDAGSALTWRFSAAPDRDGVICYTDCVKELHSRNEKDEETVETLAENACGKVWLADEDRMLWLEDLNDPQPTEFVRE